MIQDPVCGMVIDEETAEFKVEYEGETYYFCIEDCKKMFENYPDNYAGSGGVRLNCRTCRGTNPGPCPC